MKALSIRQPWAWLIANGYKDVENRTWPTKYRGPVLIHAGKTVDGDAFEAAAEILRSLNRPQPELYVEPTRYLGGILGIATITDCVDRSGSPWFFGPYGFTLKDAAPLPFIPCLGKLGFFDVPVDVESQALAALAAVGYPVEGPAPANKESSPI